jgi:hypothetical protein
LMMRSRPTNPLQRSLHLILADLSDAAYGLRSIFIRR